MTVEPTSIGCPKRMTFGPCGGVRPDHSCEVDDRPCPFVDDVVLELSGNTPRRPRRVELGHALIDLRMPATDAELAEISRIFAPVGATALVGEHVDDPVDAAPHHHARRLSAVGLPAVVTVTGRDRSPAQHRAEIEQLVEHGVRAVHCVTGDHPSVRLGPDATATFTLDGTRLASMARDIGAVVSVSESPAAPPTERRSSRVATKQRAGADLAVLNHAGNPAHLIDFADRCRADRADLALVAPVPVITDPDSAHALSQFPGLVLPNGLIESILTADDPHATGVRAAVALGQKLLDSGRFAAVNLSGSATAGSPVARAETMVEVAYLLSD